MAFLWVILCYYCLAQVLSNTSWNYLMNKAHISKELKHSCMSNSLLPDCAPVSVSTSPDSRDKFHEAGEFNYQDDPSDGPRVPLELDVLRPIFKVLGHCLMGPSSTPTLKVSAVDAAKALYARASHSLLPEAILASRSLIRLGTGPSLGPSSLEPGKSR